MLKYRMAAIALKFFSSNALMQRTYRILGNVAGGRRRKRDVPTSYIVRADGNLREIEECGGEKSRAIADGMRILELGTGWVHWEALFTRMFYDIRADLFDIWDNRQFSGFLSHAEALRQRLRQETKRDPAKLEAAEKLLDKVLLCKDFEEAYALLGFQYHVDPTGSLSHIADNSLDLVISSDVMEHIPRQALPSLCRDLWRIVKPGGHVSQQIVYTDHLTIYDRAVHPKNYLRHSERQWRLWMENQVQYINLLQPSDFVAHFTAAGFELVSQTTVAQCDTSVLDIDARFRHYPREELDVTVQRLIMRKPLSGVHQDANGHG